MEVVLGIYELRRDPEPIVLLADAPFDDVSHPELAADFAQVFLHVPIRERGRPAGDAQLADLRERVEKLLGHAVGEIGLVAGRAQVRKRENRHRGARVLSEIGIGDLQDRGVPIGGRPPRDGFIAHGFGNDRGWRRGFGRRLTDPLPDCPGTPHERCHPRQRQQAGRPALPRRLGGDGLEFSGPGRVRPLHPLRRALVRPGQNDRDRKPDQDQKGRGAQHHVGQRESLGQQVGDLQHDEPRRAVHGGDAENFPALQLGEEALVGRSL